LALTKAEKRKLKKQKRLEEKKQAESAKKSKSTKRNIIIIAIIVLVAAYAIFSFFSNSNNPAYYDDFAKCLTEKGLVVYGAEWCTYTAGQKEMFGKSFQYVNYKDYAETTGVTTTPTWELDGERYPKVQTIERLSEISGCSLPG